MGPDPVILEVWPLGYLDAADVLLQSNHRAARAYGSLVDRLAGLDGIAGNSSWAGKWSAAYDESYAQAVRSFTEVVGALGGLHRLTAASGENHRLADAGSTLRLAGARSTLGLVGAPVYVGDGDAFISDAAVEVDPRPLATVSGGRGDGPWWWSRISDLLEGFVWPDADTDALRDAAAVWDEAADDLDGVRRCLADATEVLGVQRSPEVALAIAAHDRVGSAVASLAGTCRDLADACRRHADDVEEHRETVLEIGAQMAGEAIVIQGITHGLAFFTAGTSEVPGQLIQGARLASCAAKIRAALAALATTITLRVGHVRAASTALVKQSPGLRRIATARAISASPSMEAATQASALGFTRISTGVFESPAGLIYGHGPREHRLTHLLLHAYPNSAKRTHSVFTDGTDVLKTVDEAWLRRSQPVPDDAARYVVDMGRPVGAHGERRVVLIVDDGNTLVTAYPLK